MRKSSLDAALKQVEQLYLTPVLDWDIIGGPFGRIIATARLGRTERLVVNMTEATAQVTKQRAVGRAFATLDTATLVLVA